MWRLHCISLIIQGTYIVPNLITTLILDCLAVNKSLDSNVNFANIGLTHWGWVTHICVGNLTIIGSDNGLSPGQRQAIIWTNAGILLIGPWGTNFSEILIGIHIFSFKKIHLKMSSAKWRPLCLGLSVLMWRQQYQCLASIRPTYIVVCEQDSAMLTTELSMFSSKGSLLLNDF